MCRFLRTSKSSCGALTLIIFALFPRSFSLLLSSSLVSSSLLPLFSSNRLLGPMTSICESSCLPYLFSAFCKVNMQSELWCRETTKPTDMQNKLSLDLTLRNLIRGGLGNPSDLKKKLRHYQAYISRFCFHRVCLFVFFVMFTIALKACSVFSISFRYLVRGLIPSVRSCWVSWKVWWKIGSQLDSKTQIAFVFCDWSASIRWQKLGRYVWSEA